MLPVMWEIETAVSVLLLQRYGLFVICVCITQSALYQLHKLYVLLSICLIKLKHCRLVTICFFNEYFFFQWISAFSLIHFYLFIVVVSEPEAFELFNFLIYQHHTLLLIWQQIQRTHSHKHHQPRRLRCWLPLSPKGRDWSERRLRRHRCRWGVWQCRECLEPHSKSLRNLSVSLCVCKCVFVPLIS